MRCCKSSLFFQAVTTVKIGKGRQEGKSTDESSSRDERILYTCKRPNASQDFSASAKQAYKCTATLLEPQYDNTSEARVGGQGLKSKLRATRTSSRMLLKHLECFSAHHAHSKHLSSSSKQETLSSQAPNMLCPCLFLSTPNKRFKHSSQITQCKLMVHVTCARHPVNCKGTYKEVKKLSQCKAYTIAKLKNIERKIDKKPN